MHTKNSHNEKQQEPKIVKCCFTWKKKWPKLRIKRDSSTMIKWLVVKWAKSVKMKNGRMVSEYTMKVNIVGEHLCTAY